MAIYRKGNVLSHEQSGLSYIFHHHHHHQFQPNGSKIMNQEQPSFYTSTNSCADDEENRIVSIPYQCMQYFLLPTHSFFLSCTQVTYLQVDKELVPYHFPHYWSRTLGLTSDMINQELNKGQLVNQEDTFPFSNCGKEHEFTKSEEIFYTQVSSNHSPFC